MLLLCTGIACLRVSQALTLSRVFRVITSILGALVIIATIYEYHLNNRQTSEAEYNSLEAYPEITPKRNLSGKEVLCSRQVNSEVIKVFIVGSQVEVDVPNSNYYE